MESIEDGIVGVISYIEKDKVSLHTHLFESLLHIHQFHHHYHLHHTNQNVSIQRLSYYLPSTRYYPKHSIGSSHYLYRFISCCIYTDSGT